MSWNTFLPNLNLKRLAQEMPSSDRLWEKGALQRS